MPVLYFDFVHIRKNILHQLSQSDTYTHTHLPHAHMIKHPETFSLNPVICIRKYCTKINCHGLHTYTHTQARFTNHYTLLYMKDWHFSYYNITFIHKRIIESMRNASPLLRFCTYTQEHIAPTVTIRYLYSHTFTTCSYD